MRRRNEALLLGLAGLATFAAFALVLAGPGSAQRAPALHAYWADLGHFPDWSRPLALPRWAWAGVGGVFRYCLYPLGTAFVPLAAVGFAALRRRGRGDVALFLAAPVACALAAGLMARYPFGGSRLHLYAAPGLALLVAAGLVRAWEWFGSLRRGPARLARAAAAVAVAWGAAEGATFPLLNPGRQEVRPAVEYLKARPAGEPVVVADDVIAYYLRHDPGARRVPGGADAGAPRVWVVGVFDRPGAGPSAPLLALQGLPVAARLEFGPVTVFRLDRPTAPPG